MAGSIIPFSDGDLKGNFNGKSSLPYTSQQNHHKTQAYGYTSGTIVGTGDPGEGDGAWWLGHYRVSLTTMRRMSCIARLLGIDGGMQGTGTVRKLALGTEVAISMNGLGNSGDPIIMGPLYSHSGYLGSDHTPPPGAAYGNPPPGHPLMFQGMTDIKIPPFGGGPFPTGRNVIASDGLNSTRYIAGTVTERLEHDIVRNALSQQIPSSQEGLRTAADKSKTAQRNISSITSIIKDFVGVATGGV